jgi:membrane protein DedA with SNARE-associated domain
MKYPALRFTALNTAGALLWSVTFSCVGWAIGATFTAMLRRAGRIGELIAAGIVVSVVVAMLVRRRR